MALIFIFEFPGARQEQFDQVFEKLQFGGKSPPGQLFHAGGPIEGGWRVVDVWETQEAATDFFQEKFGPALQEAGVTFPQTQVWPLHTLLRP